jgi:hypothetical protein
MTRSRRLSRGFLTGLSAPPFCPFGDSPQMVRRTENARPVTWDFGRFPLASSY